MDFESNCDCLELGYQICSHYENWCADQQMEEWYESLSDEEKDSLLIKLCIKCSSAFRNPERNACDSCFKVAEYDMAF